MPLTPEQAIEQSRAAARAAQAAADSAQAIADQIATAMSAATHGAIDPFVFRLAIFVLAIFVGYYVVWSVTPGAAHAADVGDERDLVGHCRRRAACGRRAADGARDGARAALRLHRARARRRSTSSAASSSPSGCSRCTRRRAETMSANVSNLSLSRRRRALHPGAARPFPSDHVATGQRLRHGRHGARHPDHARLHAPGAMSRMGARRRRPRHRRRHRRGDRQARSDDGDAAARRGLPFRRRPCRRFRRGGGALCAAGLRHRDRRRPSRAARSSRWDLASPSAPSPSRAR